MALLLTLLSIVLHFFSPGEVLPELAPYHLQQIIILPAVFFSVFIAASPSVRLHAPQNLLMLLFWGCIFMSFGGSFSLGSAVNASIEIAVVIVIYFLVVVNTTTLLRIRLLYAVLFLCAFVMAIQTILAYHFGYN